MTKYWHFCRDDKRLGYKDGRHIKLFRKLKVEGEPEICKHGLHASKRIIDALRYAQGSVICRVILRGKIIHGTDKSVAQERTVVAWIRGDMILDEFACKCAERALRRSKVTDWNTRLWDAIQVKRLWLHSNATDDELYAARSTAYDVAAYAAARSAAYAARSDAYAAAARSTAYDVAAYAAARRAEEIWQNRVLTRMVKQAMKK